MLASMVAWRSSPYSLGWAWLSASVNLLYTFHTVLVANDMPPWKLACLVFVPGIGIGRGQPHLEQDTH